MALRPVDEVAADVMSRVVPITDTEHAPLLEAQGRYLAKDLQSPVNVPPADNSAMDGYALNHGDVKAGEQLVISDRIPAGHPGKPLAPGTLARIFTGAEIPQGADTVVIQEDTRLEGDHVVITEMPSPKENVRPCGQDVSKGDVILGRGTRLTPDALALIASVGISEVPVYRQLTVAVMSTGDELVEPGNSVNPGQIYNSNRYALAGILNDMGMQVLDLGIIKDTPQATEQALEQAATADCILSSGGVSVGEEDHVKAAVEKLGSLDIWKLAIKPGKPLAYGEVKGTPFFGLPGNPVSSFVTFMMIAKPYLVERAGGTDSANRAFFGEADFSFKAGSRREYIRARTETGADGKVRLSRFANQGSGIMTSVVWGNALAEVEVGQEVTPGDTVKFYPY